MGLIGRILGGPMATTALGQAATGMAEVFRPNATKNMQAAHDAYIAALGEYGTEFQYVSDGPFDRFVNALNRLPRPMLALGTLGLFVYAMVDPDSFTRRMVGLNYVPEPLWWLLTAIVGFYFGAREAHYFRSRPQIAASTSSRSTPAVGDNPALAEWRRGEDR
jgi:hypothetical protein